MRVLIADDDAALRLGLRVQMERWGHEPVVAADGTAAREIANGPNPPPLMILDWSMPGTDGLTLCREIRSQADRQSTYIIMLTARDGAERMVEGLDGGADEYIVKPVDWSVLRARLQTGCRIVTLQESLAQRVRELEEALDTVKVLSGLLPICAYCKSIRNDRDYWQHLESYLSEHTNAVFSHGVCPNCYERAARDLGL